MLKTAILTAAWFMSSSAFAAEMPSHLRVRSLSHAGSACAAGNVEVGQSSDATRVKLWFETVTVSNGPGVPSHQRRHNCQLNLDLDYPDGWQLGLIGIKANGGVGLPRGASATFRLAHYVSGAASAFSVAETFTGPRQGQVTVSKVVEPSSASIVWVPCGARRALNVNMLVQVTGTRYGTAAIPGQFEGDLDVIPGPGDLDLIFAWKRCR